MTATNGSWEENRKLILSELSDIKTSLDKMQETQVSIREDIAGLKVKAAFIGAMAGSVASLLNRLF